MSELVLGAPCFRSLVVEKPKVVSVKGKIISVKVGVRYRRKSAFSVTVPSDSRFFSSIIGLRLGDEMCVSYDGEDIAEIKRNPVWKRLWLQLIW